MAGREDVQKEAILGYADRTGEHPKFSDLRTGVPEFGCIKRLRPCGARLRRLPAQRADRRGRERNAKEGVHAVIDEALNRPFGSADKRTTAFGGCGSGRGYGCRRKQAEQNGGSKAARLFSPLGHCFTPGFWFSF